MNIFLSNHRAGYGCPERTPWSASKGSGDPANSRVEAIPNNPGEGLFHYNYDTPEKHHSDVVGGFNPMSLSSCFPTSRDLPETWMAGNFNDANKRQKLEEICPQPYEEGHDVSPNMQWMTDNQRHYDPISSSSMPSGTLIPARVPEEPYQTTSTSFLHPPASDADLMMVVPSLPSPPLAISYTTLLPDQHSKYSELSANLAYMAALSGPPESSLPKEKRFMGIERRKKEKATAKAKEKHYKRVFELPEASAGALLSTLDWSGMKPATERNDLKQSLDEDIGTLQIPKSVPLAGAKHGKTTKSLPPKHIPPPRSVCRGGGPSNSGASSSGKKLGLACLFCRERKIACGRPSGSNPDQTCNQCARRLFKCEYPTESRRGQHKRSKANLVPPKP